MALTKKDQAYIESLLTISALRYTADVPKDVPRPETGTTRGFDFAGAMGDMARVEEIESGPVSHWAAGTRFSGSQGGVSLYSTRLRALKAMRRAIENESAKRLRRVDIMIKEEEKSTKVEE